MNGHASHDPARRRFVTSTFALAGAAALPRGLFAQNAAAHAISELRGTNFMLDVGTLPVNLSGRRAWAKTSERFAAGTDLAQARRRHGFAARQQFPARNHVAALARHRVAGGQLVAGIRGWF